MAKGQRKTSGRAVGSRLRRMLDADHAALFDWLEMMAKETRRFLPKGAESPQTFVLQHGRFFRPQPLPKGRGFRRGQARACFHNGVFRSIKHGLIYVEGFALSRSGGAVAIHHGWCTDESGAAFDFTWREPGVAYFGVPFTTEYVNSELARCCSLGYSEPFIRMDGDGFFPRDAKGVVTAGIATEHGPG